MEIKELSLKGVFEITPKVFDDARGFFFEAFNEVTFRSAGLPYHFLQDNQSYSSKGVLRGLHFQRAPFAQGKLVRVLRGSIIDVVVDLRKGSDSFGKHLLIPLDSDKRNMVYVPVGFAHGFVTLEDSMVMYKCTNVYDKNSDGGIRWNDPDLGIDWGTSHPVLSEKDAALPCLKDVIDDLAF
ncbi:MAG TPA: dTDP-4-dehydrorhamnose 3,5-epimerase [Cytophagaceae bacterium]|jgi:dTDP-4-dehydrorhamnose 3,5-epimerase|nr:dTDP-4-dehydrorhamnose 3,5-epimerase [Cytophagaceae bacterium]